MKKFTEEKLKAEALRIVEKFSPPDSLPGESRFQYDERKRSEALSNMAKAPQATVPVSRWGH
jgi:hypothetical protein